MSQLAKKLISWKKSNKTHFPRFGGLVIRMLHTPDKPKLNPSWSQKLLFCQNCLKWTKKVAEDGPFLKKLLWLKPFIPLNGSDKWIWSSERESLIWRTKFQCFILYLFSLILGSFLTIKFKNIRDQCG